MKKILTLLAASALWAGGQPEPFFPFEIPLEAAADTAADWSFLNGPAAGPVRIVDGRYTAAGKPIRWAGVNLTHIPREEDADKVAAHLARFGVNIVRFHHIDAAWVDGVFGPPDWGGRRSVELDPSRLRRLDVFVEALRKRGIYINMNLLTGRLFTSHDGLPADIDTIDDFKIRHAIGFWYGPILELQKRYARDLLGRRSSVSGLFFRDEPHLAVVEINNEAGLQHSWLSGHLDGLPEVFLQPLREQWNAWLRRRGMDRGAWAKAAAGVRGPDPGLEQARWNLEQHQGARATFRDGRTLRVEISAAGREGWHVQLTRQPLRLVDGGLYELTFAMRSEAPRQVEALVGLSRDPWNDIGLARSARVGTEWQDYQFLFRANTNENAARLVFSGMGLPTGWVELRSVALRAVDPGSTEWGDPARGTVALPASDGFNEWASDARRLWWAFLQETEENYWKNMIALVKNELGFQVPVVGTTTMNVSPRRSLLWDAQDEHAYWQHPEFPGEAWDRRNWFVRNLPMVRAADGGTFAALGNRRVRGRAFTVSEYNHPSPSLYSAEAYPAISMVSSLQDWDGYYAFVYEAPSAGKGIRDFFDVASHPGVWASFGPSAQLFRQKLLPRLVPEDTRLYPEAVEADPSTWRPWQGPDFASVVGWPGENLWSERRSLSMDSVPPGNSPSSPRDDFAWNTSAEVFWARTDGVEMLSGFLTGREIILRRLAFRAERNASGWGQVSLSETRPGRWVLVAHGVVRNRGTLTPLPVEGENLFIPSWETGPAEVERLVLAVAVRMEPGKKVWALDGSGARIKEVPSRYEGENLLFTTAGSDTLWWEIGN